MKLAAVTCVVLAAIGEANAFAPTRFAVRPQTARSLAPVDPSSFHDVAQHINSLQDAFSSVSLADAVATGAATVADAVQSVVPAATDATGAADAVADTASTSSGGWFGFLTGPTTGLLQLIHTGLVAVGVSQNAWGVSIIVLTLIIKALTFPLTKTQLESTNKMQALQPAVKEIQAKYQSNPEVMNQKIAEMYQTNQVNPLAGCIPSLVQIPVFIGLYRAVLDLAQDNKLDEPFLFLPNLEGPMYGAQPSEGASWLFNWVNGAPPLGWEDTVAFLILPVFLVASQFISMELMQPKDQKPAEGSAILKFLPFLIGWFSLTVPAALCIYWVTNNIVTTATSLFIRSTMNMEPVSTGGGGGAATAPSPTQDIFAPPPMREKPSGFSPPPSTPVADADGVTPITAVDAEIIDDGNDDKKKETTPKVQSSSSKGGKKRRNKKKKKN